MKRVKLAVIVMISALAFITHAQQSPKPSDRQYGDWKIYGGGAENIHYSTLSQITPENVKRLEVAWRYDTGDEFKGSEMQCNPVIVDGVMYATTPRLRVLALDAATGKLIWSFDPNEGKKDSSKMRNRGVTVWDGGPNLKRLFVAYRHRLFSLDARTGQPDRAFGENGWIDLRRGLGRDSEEGLTVSVSTPGVVYKDLLIVGSIVSEALPAAPGDIRAYDLRSGKLRWSFRTIPQAGEFGADTWPQDARSFLGGANNWTGLAVDQRRGLVFAPTGSAAFDFYGGNRRGDNLFANTLLCLDANTGQRIWHFQGVKHDVWDRDFPAMPALVTVKRDGRDVDAVAQITKSGHVYLFERETGKPLFPIEYRKYPASPVAGESLAETQPLPSSPAFSRQRLTEEMLTRRTPEAHEFALEKFRKLRSNGQFEPPSLEGTVIFPGFDGGGEWGGGAFDPETGLIYVNANEMAWVLRIVEKPKPKELPSGKSLYEENCASCHKPDLSGSPPEFPSLKEVDKKLTEQATRDVIRNGRGRMPGFARLGDDAVHALTQYIRTGRDVKTAVAALDPRIDQKYTFDGYNRFLDQDGYPAIAPPWGTLNAIDLNAGRIVWQIPFGEYPELAAKGMKNSGSENYGGSIVTRNGLLFIGATNYDKKFRAFDKKTGALLWETELPAAGNATPAMYEVGGRQFVVIAAGGGKWGAPSGGSYIAFALPPQAKDK